MPITTKTKDYSLVWYGPELMAGTKGEYNARLALAAMKLRDKVVVNISRPVTKIKRERKRHTETAGGFFKGQFKKGSGGTFVDPKSRSKIGEFPKSDTTRLRKDIFASLATNQALRRTGKPAAKKTGLANTKLFALVGTTLIYGAFHETHGRSFLLRTLREYGPVLKAIMGTKLPPTPKMPQTTKKP